MAHKLEYYVAQPQSNQTSEARSLPEGTAILLGTPVASCIYPDGDILGGDTGVRAQALANEFNTKVIAWQDLGPKVRFAGLLAARNRMSVNNFAEYASESAETIGQALQTHDIGNTVMRIHSGVGPVGTGLAIALHAQPDLTVSHIAISDPVGLRRTNFFAGGRLVLAYSVGAARATPQEHRNDPLHPKNSFTSFLSDVAVRGTTIWLTDTTYRNLITIGNDQIDTAVLLHLPGNTLNGPPAEAQAMATTIQNNVKRADETFVVAFEPNHYHSSEYDSLQRNADFIRRALALAPLT